MPTVTALAAQRMPPGRKGVALALIAGIIRIQPLIPAARVMHESS
ncbi:hypothetical protein [Lonsdalea quercina]